MPAPLVSVIIACRNPGPKLPAAVASIRRQSGADIETVIVDGASTDGTREWLQSESSRLGAWLSEPDAGVYDAMNKGAALAQGAWLLFLGADDQLVDGALAAAAPHLSVSTGGILAGEARYADGRTYRGSARPGVIRRNFLHHQACFYHRSIFAHQRYDQSFPIQADYEFNLRLWHTGIRPTPLPVRIALCGTGGLSDGGSWANYRDEIRARHRHFPAWQCWLWDLGSVARYCRKNLVRSFAKKRPE
jgi:putative colanic acid biosynthesis glycosyltransferase